MCPAVTWGYEIQSWKPAVSEAAAATFRVAEQVRSGAKTLTLIGRLWQLDRTLRQTLKKIYNPPKTAKTTIDEAEAKWVIDKLREMVVGLDTLYMTAKKRGFTNGTVMGPALDSIRTQTEELLDLAETIELALNPDVDRRFSEAEQEFERGQGIPLSSLR